MASTRGAWWPFLLAGALLGGGVALLGYAVLSGQASAGVFVVFPFVIGSSPLLALGVVVLVLGLIALTFAGSVAAIEDAEEAPPARPRSGVGGTDPADRRGETSFGGFLMIGPVPIVFGNRSGWAPYLVALALATAIALLAFALLLTRG